MSKRNKRRKARQSNTQILERAERELAKGNAKTALKETKVAYRKTPTPEARKLLEAAFAGRVEQLQRQNMLSEAQAVLHELIDFNPTDPEIRQRLPRLQVLVGDQDADPAALFELQPELLIDMTDRAVLDWESLAPEHAGIPDQVKAVRDSLSAIEAGDDQRAAELLQAIPRTSLLADWKLFARGLSAFYQHDADRTTANWRRLDPNRPARRIARTLQVAATDIRVEEASDVARSVKRLKMQTGGGRGYEQLDSLADAWHVGNWRKFLHELRNFCKGVGKTSEVTVQKIGELAWRRVVREHDPGLLQRLRGSLPAPDLDPKWNRALAFLAEVSPDGDATAVEEAWKAYARDLRELPGLRDQDRRIAEGLVYLRLGRKFIEFARYSATRSIHLSDDDEEAEEAGLRKSAASFFRTSIQICPRLTDAYRELAELYEALEETDKAAATYKSLLQQVPDDFRAYVWLARYHLERDEPENAKEFTLASQRLKPRDPRCVALDWTQKLTTVRCLTKSRKLDEARVELEKMRATRPPEIDLFSLDLIAAAIEFKAKDADKAKQFVETAVSRLEEPTAVWQQMSFACARFSLSRDIKKVFDQKYKKDIEREPTSQTAGLLAKQLATIKGYRINYVGRATHERLAIAYLKRAAIVQWEEADICHVCAFLRWFPRQLSLREELADAGLEQFPDSPQLLVAVGEAELLRGTYDCDVDYALRCLRSAIEKNDEAGQPMSPAQVEHTRTLLSGLEDAAKRGPSYDFDDDNDEDDPLSDYGSTDVLPCGVDLDALIDAMPPELRKAAEMAAADTGRDVEEVAKTLVQMAVDMGLLVPGEPSGRRGEPQPTQTHFGFLDD